MKKTLSKLPMNLQLFAEDNQGSQPNTSQGQEQENSYEEADSEEDEQAKIDAIVEARLKRQREKDKRDHQKEIDDAVKAALKKHESLQNMSDAEKREQELLDREHAIQQREAEADFKELLSDTKNILADKDIPTSFAEFIVVKGDAEATHENINEFENTLKAYMAERDKARLRQLDPKTGGHSAGTHLSEGARKAQSINEKRQQRPQVSNWGTN